MRRQVCTVREQQRSWDIERLPRSWHLEAEGVLEFIVWADKGSGITKEKGVDSDTPEA